MTWLGNGSGGARTDSIEVLRLMEHDTIERLALIREAAERRRERQAAEAATQHEDRKALLRAFLLTAIAGNKAHP